MTNEPEPTKSLRQLFAIEQQGTSARYFFDVNDGERSFQDDNGINLYSADQIASEAYNILRQIVHDRLPEGQRTMTVRVRDGSGKLVYAGTMTIDGQRSPP